LARFFKVGRKDHRMFTTGFGLAILLGLTPSVSPVVGAAGEWPQLVRDGGVLTCLRAETGEELFRERLGAPGQHVASPVASGRLILFASTPGVVKVVEAADELKVLALNPLNEEIFATPALVECCVYIRTTGHLHAFGRALAHTEAQPSF